MITKSTKYQANFLGDTFQVFTVGNRWSGDAGSGWTAPTATLAMSRLIHEAIFYGGEDAEKFKTQIKKSIKDMTQVA
jgi:hypothetical protein